jgi:hypothetical protein
VETALTLFTADAAIDDVSVGEKFLNTVGVRKYLEKYFVAYQTVTKVLSSEVLDSRHVNVHVDFTGTFGHETGDLHITLDPKGKISQIAASLD